MKVFVRSRWVSHPQGLGYFWQPSEPPIARTIESYPELVSLNFLTLALWAKWHLWGRYSCYLYVDGIKASYSDAIHRTIMHSVLWEGTKKEEEAFRRIMVAAVSGQLEGKLAGIIHPDPRKGFDYEDAPLCAIGALGTSLKTSPDEEARSCLFADGSAFLDKVQTHRLPELPFKKLCPERGGSWLQSPQASHSKLSNPVIPT